MCTFQDTYTNAIGSLLLRRKGVNLPNQQPFLLECVCAYDHAERVVNFQYSTDTHTYALACCAIENVLHAMCLVYVCILEVPFDYISSNRMAEKMNDEFFCQSSIYDVAAVHC